MSDDPRLDKLARFTPVTNGLDRDDLLFRAGRASARTPWGWKAAILALAASNALTLALWPRPAEPGVSVRPPTEYPAPVTPTPEPPPAVSPGVDPSSYLALSRGWGETGLPRITVPENPPGPTPKPLTAGSRDGLY